MKPVEERRATRILLVEDEAIIARDLKRRLEKLGYEVVGIADNGAEALSLAKETRPALIFMDIVLQGSMDGVETAAELMRHLDVPIVFLTAHTDPATIDRAKRVCPYGYLVKPFEERELATAIEMALYRHQSEARARLLRSAIASAATGIVVADARRADRRVTLCNPAFERMSGYSAADLVDRPLTLLQGPSSDPAAFEELERALEERRGSQITTVCHGKDGRPFWDEITLSPVRNSIGEVTHFLLSHTDISQRKRAEAALLQSQKLGAVGQLAGGVAHDFNNILGVILSFAEFVRETLPVGTESHADIDEVISAAKRGSQLTRQLLTYTREQPSSRRPLDLNTSLAGLLSMIRRSVGEHIEIDVVASARPAIVRADPVQIDQILMNLAVNARDAMLKGGRLRFTVSHPAEQVGPFPAGRCVRLVVADSGRGMDSATLERVFEPFFSTKEVGKGTGLGLATCFTIIKESGGTIGIGSVEGQGTTLTIDLPVCDDPVAEELDTIPPDLKASGQRILVVEDETVLRGAAVRMLESAGFHVIHAKDGDEAMKRIDESGAKLDVVFTDVVMPGRGGFDVAEYARRHAPGAVVLLTSGYLDDRSRTSDRPDGTPLLWKPYTRMSLLRAVHAALKEGKEAAPPPAAPAKVTAPQRAVLLIEDQPAVRTAFQRVLTRAGYQVAIADCVAAAREALAPEHDYLAVLCDLSLPDGSGVELIRWLLKVRPALARRTFILTGGAVDDAGRRLVAEGVVEVLSKPIEPKILLERVAAAASRERAAVTSPPRPRSSSTAPPPHGGAILLIEDDDAQRAGYTRQLRSAGFTVRAAGSGEEAVAILESERFDAIVTDIRLPGLDGLAVLQAARARDAELPVLLMTAEPSVESATRAIHGRAVSYLAKPFEAGRLVEELERAVEAGQIARLQRKLLASRAGADAFLLDLAGTRKKFDAALKGLHMVYQPIVRCAGGSIFGYEALLRSDEPTLDTPPKLLAAAEVLGRSDDVGRAVRRAVAETLAAHPERTEAIFVNLHPSELRSELLCAATEPLRRSAARVVLEVTERASLAMGPELSEDVRRLREQGYRIAIDDLGEGYAGLSWLVQLKPDIAKIDMSIVRDAPRSPLKKEILGSLINVCRRGGITVIAEGVETRDEAQLLIDLGCDLIQGYFFARPGPPFPEARRSLEDAST